MEAPAEAPSTPDRLTRGEAISARRAQAAAALSHAEKSLASAEKALTPRSERDAAAPRSPRYAGGPAELRSPLPAGWHLATDESGGHYYYSEETDEFGITRTTTAAEFPGDEALALAGLGTADDDDDDAARAARRRSARCSSRSCPRCATGRRRAARPELFSPALLLRGDDGGGADAGRAGGALPSASGARLVAGGVRRSTAPRARTRS